MRIEIFRSNIVGIGVLSRFRVENRAVAIAIPLVPIVALRSFSNLVLRLIASSLDRDVLALTNTSAALRSCDFYFAFADQHFGMVIVSDKNSETGIATLSANRNIRSIDLRIRVAVAEHGIIGHPTRQLDLNLSSR
jgi:hypothetical protein